MTDEDVVAKDSSLERIDFGLNTAKLLSTLKESDELWKQNTWRQDEAGGQQDTEAIMFRWADHNSFARVRDSTSVVDTGLFAEIPEARDVIFEAVKQVGTMELGRVFVVKLKPGGRVYPHADVGLYADKFERFHICLQADDDFKYYVQHPMGPVQWCSMKPGELWWFNHKRFHWSYNGSKTDRISIIMDCVSHMWKRKRDVLALRGYGK